jgi:GTP-binding protein
VNSREFRVAIVGRPNVGKSTLFNLLIGQRRSLVKNEPGVTRDVIEMPASLWGKDFILFDTGGLTGMSAQIEGAIKDQVLGFLSHTDLLLMVFDFKAGFLPEDREILKQIRQAGKPALYIVNKVDSYASEAQAKLDFAEVGEEVLPVSLESQKGVSELTTLLYERLPEKKEEAKKTALRICILGKPNVGKSSLLNELVGYKRSVVSEVAGTTTDFVEERFEYNGQEFVVVDTAGIRRKSKMEEGLEVLSVIQARKALEQSDWVLFVVDAQDGLSVQEAKILELIFEFHKPFIMVANKIDLFGSQAEARQKIELAIGQKFHFYQDCPVVFISALKGQGIQKLLQLLLKLHQKAKIHIPTPKLNDFLFSVIRKTPSPVYQGRNVKIYYMTQTRQIPPTFLVFSNLPEGMSEAYQRFLIRQIKESFDLTGLPIRLVALQGKA